MDEKFDRYYHQSIDGFLIIFNCIAVKNLNAYRYSFIKYASCYSCLS